MVRNFHFRIERNRFVFASINGAERFLGTACQDEHDEKRNGAGVLSYGHLIANDARGRKLAARMETNPEGSEIALVIDDRGATYPIEIDPVTATLEQKLDGGGLKQTNAEFGDAVAIDGNTAIIGAWREDAGQVNQGIIYIFTRSGSTWTNKYSQTTVGQNSQCGWSVAIDDHQERAAVGCPGNNSNTGVM